MLINSTQIIENQAERKTSEMEVHQPEGISINGQESVCADATSGIVTMAIGQLQPGKTTHYYSYGNFNLVRLIMYIINLTRLKLP